MTRLLRDPEDISNYIDELVDGIGLRGSSFRDVDRLTVVHNGGGAPRFLFQELKWRDEWDWQTPGQLKSLEWLLNDLARIPSITAVTTIVEPDGSLSVRDYQTRMESNYSPDQYRAWFKQWWFPSRRGLRTA